MSLTALLAEAGIEPPKQDRSRRSYYRILEATAELLAERPFDEVSVDDIVERAGYTKGAFYHRFDSKATLLRHLVTRLTTGAVAAWTEFLDPAAWQNATLQEVLDAFVHRLVAIYSRSTNLMRAFAWEARWGTDPVLRATAEQLNAHVVERLLALVESRHRELGPAARADPDAALRFWLAALTSLLQAVYLWPQPGLSVRDDADGVERRARELLVPYVLAGSGPAPGR